MDSANASSVTPLGSTFVVDFTPSLQISPAARNVSLSLVQATVWWTVPNLEAVSITVRILASEEVPTAKDVVVSFRKGIYTYKEVNKIFNNAFTEAEVDPLAVSFNPNWSTNLMVMSFGIPAELTFDLSTSALSSILGFNNGTYRYYPIGGENQQLYEAQTTAKFDSVQFLMVGTNMVDRGFQIGGGRYKNVIAKIGIVGVDPGFQIVHEPPNPLEVTTQMFNGDGLSRAEFTLMDQTGQPVDTNGQPWSLLLRIRYYI